MGQLLEFSLDKGPWPIIRWGGNPAKPSLHHGWLHPDGSEELEPFTCPVCGNPIGQGDGYVAMMPVAAYHTAHIYLIQQEPDIMADRDITH